MRTPKPLKIKPDEKWNEIWHTTRARWGIPVPTYYAMAPADHARLTVHTLYCWLSRKAALLDHVVNGCENSLECTRCGASLAYDVETLTAQGALAVSIGKKTLCKGGPQ